MSNNKNIERHYFLDIKKVNIKKVYPTDIILHLVPQAETTFNNYFNDDNKYHYRS